jgi:hypothetical protein
MKPIGMISIATQTGGLALHDDQFEARQAEPCRDTDRHGVREQTQRRTPARRKIIGGRQ